MLYRLGLLCVAGLLVLAVSFIESTPAQLEAQAAPRGACALPSGEWCWPSRPLPRGSACSCPGHDATGTIR